MGISNVPGTITRYSLPGTISDIAGTITNNGGFPVLNPAYLFSGITYTQSGNLYVYNSAGTLTLAAVDTLTLDYDPTTLALRGYPFWEARTNIAVRSQQFDDGVYSPSGATVSPDVIASPTAVVNADKLAEDGTTGNHRIGQTYAGWTNGTTYTLSVFAKAAERTKFQLSLPVTAFTTEQLVTFDLTAVTATAASGTPTGTIQTLPNGWFRCTITATATTTAAGGMRIYLYTTSNSYTGTIGSGAYFFGLDLEAGAFVTPYIPTVASAVTRAAPSCAITGSNFSSWYNQDAGTFAITSTMSYVAAGLATALRIDDTTDNERIVIRANGSGVLEYFGIDGGVGQWNLNTGNTLTANTQFKFAAAYATNDIGSYLNGANPLTDTSATLPTETRALIGSASGGNFLNGWLNSLSYYPARLPAASLQSLST